jgi:hypothetical protein
VPDFATFVLDQLPPPPGRVLEVGCGREGGLVELLAARGYDVLGVDPHAPGGERFLRRTFEDAARDNVLLGEWDAVVAGRVLHHVNPLDEGIAQLAALAPLLVVDEFASNRIDAAAQDWYESQHRILRASGVDPYGPPSLDDWRERHPGLHSDDALLAALRAHYDELLLERVPYLHRWLEGPSSETLEQGLVAAGAFDAIGYRWVGRSRS